MPRHLSDDSQKPIGTSSAQNWRTWLSPALLSPLFLGMAPVLGKLAYVGGSDPFTVAAVRTTLAALALWIIYLLVARKYIYIFPAGLLGCVVIGVVNGLGSLMYYNGLQLVNASVAQVLNATYLIFVVVMIRLSGQRLTQRTIIRVLLTLLAILILAGGNSSPSDWLGVGLMVGNAIMFAGTVILSQRVLYEMPAPTVTLYTVTTMAIVVVMARAVYRMSWLPQSNDALLAIAALGVTTALSRLTLFAGVKRLGGLQTALVVALETGVTLLLSLILLPNETLTLAQWVGIAIMAATLLFARTDDIKRRSTQTLPVVNMAGLQFVSHATAFDAAFSVDARRKSANPAGSAPTEE